MGLVLLRRIREHRVLFAASLSASLLGATVLATLYVFAGAVGDSSLRQVLDRRSAGAASLVISADVPRERAEEAQRAVVAGAERAFDGLPVTVRRTERSGPYELTAGAGRAADPPRAGVEARPVLTHLGVADRERVVVVAGALPERVEGAAAADRGPVEVAVPSVAAEQLGLRPGQRFGLTGRLAGGRLEAVVTGVYRVADADDPYWLADPLRGRGVRTVEFTTYGPLLVDPAVLASGRVAAGPTAWSVRADYSTMTVGRVDALAAAAERGAEELAAEAALGGGATVTTELPSVLERFSRSLLVTRSLLVIVAVQLVLLTAGVLLLVARMLGGEQARETEVLRARGASDRRIAGLAVAEALLSAVPAAVCAALLAGPLARLLGGGRHGEGTAGPWWEAAAAPGVWLVAAGTAALSAGCTAAALTAASRPGRGGGLPGPLRAGADVALLLAAAVAYWRLRRQADTAGSGALSVDADGRLGIDPLLVAAPALTLLAGTVLVLRLVPPAARLAERWAARGRSLPAALAAWQFSRRPQHGSRPVLLLVLAVAIGMLALAQGASWRASQPDQADFRAGASLRVADRATRVPGDAARYAALPGAEAAAPAYRDEQPMSGNRMATVLALDTRHAAERMLLRADLADRDPEALMAAVRTGAPGSGEEGSVSGGPAGLVVPAGTDRVTLRMRLADAATGRPVERFEPTVLVQAEDAHGLGYRLPAGAFDDGAAVLTAVLRLGSTGGEPGVAPAGPVVLTGVVLQGRVPPRGPADVELTLDEARAEGPGAASRPLAVPAGLRWAGSVRATVDGEEQPPARPTASAAAHRPLSARFPIGHPSSGGLLGTPAQSVEVRLWAARPAPPDRVAGIATDAYLAVSGARVGDTVSVTLGGSDVRVRIAGSVRHLPTTGAGAADPSGAGAGAGTAGAGSWHGGALLLDLPAVNTVLRGTGDGEGLAPTEWWIAAAPGQAAGLAERLRARPDVEPADVLVRDEIAARLRGDPLGAAPRTALLAAAAAAALLAAVGYACGVVGAARARRAELAVLHAMGAGRCALARYTALDQGVLIVVAALTGVGLGAAVTHAVVPMLVLTEGGAPPVPEVLVALPSAESLVLLVAVALPPLATAGALMLRRTRAADTLRQGGEAS